MMMDFLMEDGGNNGSGGSGGSGGDNDINSNGMNGNYYWNNADSAPAASTSAASEGKSEVANALDSFQAEQQSFQLSGSTDVYATASSSSEPMSQPLYQTTLGGSGGTAVSTRAGATNPHQTQQQYYYVQQPAAAPVATAPVAPAPALVALTPGPAAPAPSLAAPTSSPVAPVPATQQPQLVPRQYFTTGAPVGATPAPGAIAGPAPASRTIAAPGTTTATPGAIISAPGTTGLVQQLPAGSYVLPALTTSANPQQYQTTTAAPSATSAILQPTGIVTSAPASALPVLSTTTVSPPLVPPPPIVPPTPKKKFPMKPIPKDLPPQEKQRFERNLREQQRSFQISQQIKELRTVLLAANIPLNSNKYSILLAAGEYIKQLQARAIMNEAEHRKLVATLQQTNEAIQNPQLLQAEQVITSEGKDDDQLFVHGLDYKAVVQQNASAAIGVAALDGRFLECNTEFENVTGLTRDQLRQQTLFNLLQDQKQVFEAMGAMLKNSSSGGLNHPGNPASNDSVNVSSPMYWSGLVSGRGNPGLKMNITLAKSSDGQPRFFNCALTAAS